MARKPADQSVHRDDIILAAADVLHEHGYDATTMKDIAARVNLTAASLYHHFKSKDHLLLAVLEKGLSLAIAQIEPVACSEQGNADKLRQMIAIHIRAMTSNPAVGAAMVFEIRSLMQNGTRKRAGDFYERRERFFTRRDYFEVLFKHIVQQGVDAGEFRAVDAGIFTKAMLGAHNWVGVWYRPAGRLDGDDIADIMADTFLTSLQPTLVTDAIT